MNQTLKQYFRCYINYWQNNWVQLLSVTQLTFNSATMKVISISSFFTNYKFKSKMLKKSVMIVSLTIQNINEDQYSNKLIIKLKIWK